MSLFAHQGYGDDVNDGLLTEISIGKLKLLLFLQELIGEGDCFQDDDINT